MLGFRRASMINRATRPVIEGLETRQLLSATLGAHGALVVTGTPHNDVINITLDKHHKAQLDVSVDGKTKTFTSSKVKSLVIKASAGNDIVTEASNVLTPSVLNAGTGNDTEQAGGGTDTLDGGTGNDTLIAGPGHDTIDCEDGTANVEFGPNNGVPITDPSLPAAVVTGLTTLANGATITNVVTFHDRGQTYYGTVITIGGVNTRLVVDALGNPITDWSSTGKGQSEGYGEDDHHGAFGTVVSTTADVPATSSAAETLATVTIAVNSEHGAATNQTFSVADSAVITVDGATTALANLTAGMVVAVQTTPADPTTATAITGVNVHAEGFGHRDHQHVHHPPKRKWHIEHLHRR